MTTVDEDDPLHYSDEEIRDSRRLVAVAAADMTMKSPRWLYDRRIPAGAITLLAGREGIGKSTIAFDLAARITRGMLPGRHEGTPRGVAVIASEDDWSAVILPRLVAARADRSRIYRLEARTEEGDYETLSVPTDLAELEIICAERDVVMVIIDPIMSVIHGSLDTHKDREVRRALDPLSRFTSTSGVAALGLIHVNKSSGSDPLNSIMASRAFTAVARSVLYCIVDPEAENEDRYLFGHPKSNLGPKQGTLGYHLLECKLELEGQDDEVIVTSRVTWGGQDSRSIRDAMEPKRPERATGAVATRILDWITEQDRAVSVAELAAELPDVKRNTLDQNLARMARRGTLTRPLNGMYALPSDTRTSDTSLETSEVSEVSEMSPGLTPLTDLTAPDARGPLSEHPSEIPADCPVCHWPIDSQAHETQCGEAS